jgi:integrase/recombinase XerD
MELGFKAGFRKGAMQNLLWERIDFEEGYAYVVDKGQKEKCYLLAPSILDWLKRLRLVRKAAEGRVILSPKSNTAISDTSLHDEFKRYVRLCGVNEKETGLHSMRHTYGTTLHEQGFDIRDIQVAMGHDDIGFTQVYVDVPKKELREKIKRVFSKSK